MPLLELVELQGSSPADGLSILEHEIWDNPVSGLFVWTLTHRARAFTEIEPIFDSQKDLLDHINLTIGKRFGQPGLAILCDSKLSSKITQIALTKMAREWRAWVNVHEDLLLDERKLDNMLMSAIYRIILARDGKTCALCRLERDLTIHHIIQKKRNVTSTTPPFGRSVPTNLITLCRDCHAIFDPMILN